MRALDTLLALGSRDPGSLRTRPLRVLDVGCGTGAQTLQLARNLDGIIVAVDNHQPYLDELARRARVEGLEGKIELRLKDMHTLGQADGVFDLVRAEGSLFVMGFEAGLEACFDRLAPGGLAAVSELAWLVADPPAECREFFAGGYPAMLDIAGNERLIAKSGFELLDEFVTPDSSWWDGYYCPLEGRLLQFYDLWAADTEKSVMVGWVQAEIDIRRSYPASYGNTFFLLRRPDR